MNRYGFPDGAESAPLAGRRPGRRAVISAATGRRILRLPQPPGPDCQCGRPAGGRRLPQPLLRDATITLPGSGCHNHYATITLPGNDTTITLPGSGAAAAGPGGGLLMESESLAVCHSDRDSDLARSGCGRGGRRGGRRWAASAPSRP